ncbi:MAG TPA: hypothetical protein VF100_12605 [Thermoanaerobaculia bacterium]
MAASLLLAAGAGGQPAPLPAHDPAAAGGLLFAAADRCLACHNGLVTPAGADVSIGADWQTSMMANAARDPYWQAAVRRELLDHPESAAAIEDKCSTCHMPMARTATRAAGGTGGVFAHLPIGAHPAGLGPLAADGVSCSVCHQIQPDGLGEPASFTGGFAIAPVSGAAGAGAAGRTVYGPFTVIPGLARVMASATAFAPAAGTHVQTSELCATCHTLHTHSLGPGGAATGELPEQAPYLEWRESAFAREGRSCQSCHMPEAAAPTPASSVLGEPRAALSRHVFRGGNFLMPRIFQRFAAELGVTASPGQLELMAARTREHLATASARLEVASAPATAPGEVAVDVTVVNLAGHKLPTAYPSRRAWLHLVVRDAAGAVVFESGAPRPDGSIAGNDNDADPAVHEPHHDAITAPGQVQIYETILAAPDGTLTTGLLTATGYAKDNRLLPRGFAKTAAPADVAVHGTALADADFTAGGDRVRYRVAVGAAPRPLRVEARLWYQPIAHRWAENLAAYDAAETARFVRMYRAVAGESAIVLAAAEVAVP